MNFRILLVILFAVANQASPSIFSERMKKPDTYYLQKSIIDLISPQTLKRELNNFLKDTYPSRSHQSSGHSKIGQFFSSFARENEISFDKQSYVPDVAWAKKNLDKEFNDKVARNFKSNSPTYKKWRSFVNNVSKEYEKIKVKKFTNYIWKKTGENSKKTLIISANIDSIGQLKNKSITHKGDFFGANDNASSVVALLELLKVLNKIELPFDVIIVFFDLQEFGNLGAHAFVSQYLKSSGDHDFYHINGLMISKLFNSSSLREFKLYGQASALNEPNYLSKVNNLVPEVKIKRVLSSYAGSDAGPFTDYAIASVTLMGLSESDQEKVIHQISDTVESINFYHYHLGAKLLFSLVINFLYPV